MMDAKQRKSIIEKVLIGLNFNSALGKPRKGRFWWTWRCEFSGLPIAKAEVMTCNCRDYLWRLTLKQNVAGIAPEVVCGQVKDLDTPATELACCGSTPPVPANKEQMLRLAITTAINGLWDVSTPVQGVCCSCQQIVDLRPATAKEREDEDDDFAGEQFDFRCLPHVSFGARCEGAGDVPQALVK